jgi:AraC-like DNA-binding protein
MGIWDILINSNVAGFTTEAATIKFGPLMLGRSVSQMQRYLRSYQHFAEDGFDHFFVQIFQKGNSTGSCGKTQLSVCPGDIIITDLSQSAEIESTDFDNLILVIPRQMLQKYLRFPERLHGQILKRESLSGKLLHGQIKVLSNNVSIISSGEINTIAEGLVGLVAAYFAGFEFSDKSTEIQPTLRENIQSYIDQHLTEANLTPESLASRFYISRARLYRLFESTGGIAQYIREQRLKLSLNMLKQSTQQRRIVDIAFECGFNDAAHFSRSFRRTFGISPHGARRDGLLRESVDLNAKPDLDTKIGLQW